MPEELYLLARTPTAGAAHEDDDDDEVHITRVKREYRSLIAGITEKGEPRLHVRIPRPRRQATFGT